MLLENIVALHLYITHKECLYYFKGNKADIDFYLSEFNTAMQVAYSVNEKDAYDREVNSLIAFTKTNHSKSNLMIVTYEEERIIEIDGLLIKVVPLKNFLLS